MEVLPTPWSPKNTILYFANGEIFGAAVDVPASAMLRVCSLVSG